MSSSLAVLALGLTACGTPVGLPADAEELPVLGQEAGDETPSDRPATPAVESGSTWVGEESAELTLVDVPLDDRFRDVDLVAVVAVERVAPARLNRQTDVWWYGAGDRVDATVFTPVTVTFEAVLKHRHAPPAEREQPPLAPFVGLDDVPPAPAAGSSAVLLVPGGQVEAEVPEDEWRRARSDARWVWSLPGDDDPPGTALLQVASRAALTEGRRYIVFLEAGEVRFLEEPPVASWIPAYTARYSQLEVAESGDLRSHDGTVIAAADFREALRAAADEPESPDAMYDVPGAADLRSAGSP